MSNIPRKHPQLMVIGDSLAQGCRSMSVAKHYSQQCYANLIAQQQGWDFRVPDFNKNKVPECILFDMERELRKLDLVLLIPSIPGFINRFNKNLKRWRDGLDQGKSFSSQHCFDNLAVAGASLSDLKKFTYNSCREAVISTGDDGLLDFLEKDRPIGKPKLADVHLHINAAYTLNPQHRSEWKGWSALEWVRRRQPRNLIAHLGHNDGLYPIGGGATYTDLKQTTLPKYRKVVDELIALPKSIKQIALILLPKVSCVANLEPFGQRDSEGYYENYFPVFSSSGDYLTRKQMKQVDEDVRYINAEIVKKVRKADPDLQRFRLISAYDIFSRYDFKNTLETSRQVQIKKKLIDNRYLSSVRKPRPPRHGRNLYYYYFQHGGFQSLDGMHPTAVGYAIFACEIMDALSLSYNRKEVLETALKNEKLISGKFPGLLNTVLDLMHSSRWGKVVRPDVSNQSKPEGDICANVGEQIFCGK